MSLPICLFALSSRAAMFIASPIAVYCIRLVPPKFPTITGPRWMPMRVRPSATPCSAFARSVIFSPSACIAKAQATARAVSSSLAIGAPHYSNQLHDVFGRVPYVRYEQDL